MVELWLDLDWIVNPFWKVDLDFQSHFCDRFGLDWQSKIIGLSNSLPTLLMWYQSHTGLITHSLVLPRCFKWLLTNHVLGSETNYNKNVHEWRIFYLQVKNSLEIIQIAAVRISIFWKTHGKVLENVFSTSICLHQGRLLRNLGILRNVNKDASGM